MQQPHILIVGNSTKTLKKYLEVHNFDFTVLKEKSLTKFPDKHFKHRVVTDFSNPEVMLQAVDTIQAKKPINGLLTVYERFIKPAAHIAKHLDLPGLPLDAAEACTDKDIMRQRFAASSEKISPDFAVVANENDLRNFAGNHTFPLILKPANLTKSLLVTKASSLDELLQAYRKTTAIIDRIYKKYAPSVVPKLLIEEFMQGSVHSVDAFVDNTGKPHVLDAVVDYQTGHDIGFADNFHYSRLLPSQLPHEITEQIRHVAALGCKALNMRNSPAHVEIILTAEGPRIVEIGARNGGYRDRMHALANGIDIDGAALAVCLGEQPYITADRNESVGVFELFPKTPGLFTELENEAMLRLLPSLVYLSVKAKPGEFVGSSSDGYKACAIVILHHANAHQFAEDMRFLNHHVWVQTVPDKR